MCKTPDELIADYISLYIHMGKPHELKRKALRDYRAGKPFTAELKYIHRRIVKMIGEHEANTLIAAVFETMKLLSPESKEQYTLQSRDKDGHFWFCTFPKRDQPNK